MQVGEIFDHGALLRDISLGNLPETFKANEFIQCAPTAHIGIELWAGVRPQVLG